MNSIPAAAIINFLVASVGFLFSFAGFILMMRQLPRVWVAWQKPRSARSQLTYSVGELSGCAVGFVGIAIVFGNQLVDEVQHGAELRLTMFSFAAFAGGLFVSGLSFGRLLERGAARREQRLADGAATRGEVAQG